MIDTDDTGDDMRGCKRLVSDHTAAEAELGAVEQKVADLSAVASDLAEGHFDGASILMTETEMRAAVAAMKEPAEARKQALMQSMKFHELNFDLAREMEWVAEKRHCNGRGFKPPASWRKRCSTTRWSLTRSSRVPWQRVEGSAAEGKGEARSSRDGDPSARVQEGVRRVPCLGSTPARSCEEC